MEYAKMTLLQLRALAKERGLKGISTLKKDKLIERLEGADAEGQGAAAPQSGDAGEKKENDERKRGRRAKEKTSEGGQAIKAAGEPKESRKEKTAEDGRTIRKAGEPKESQKEKTPEGGQAMEATGESEESRKEKEPEGRETRAPRGNRRTKEAGESRGTRGHRAGRKAGEPEKAGENPKDTEMPETEGSAGQAETGETADANENPEARDSGSAGTWEHKKNNRRTFSRKEGEETRDFGDLDSGNKADGILEVMPDGFGFIRCENYLPGENDVYVSPSQIRRFNLKTGDILKGNIRVKTQNEKYSALLFVESVNGYKPYDAQKRANFENMTPIFPDERIYLETQGGPTAMRMVDLISPIGKGQRGMIVSQPKTGKTTLLKQIAKSIMTSYPDMKIIVLLIDERPEEVTDIREYIEGPNAEVIYSTFDELPEHHRRVSEMVLERAKRLVEHKQDVVILLDSITRLARAYNLVVPPSGRTLSGGLDPAALHMPKKFFGAARNMREGGSLTILATALVDTGSKMDDVVFEEFKGTGNMELVLDRKLSEKRIFPAINIRKSGTRRDDLLLTKEEQEVVFAMHREMSGSRAEENIEEILGLFKRTRNNREFIEVMRSSLLKSK